MKTEPSPGYYPPYEEKLNIITHGFGFGLSILGLILLIVKAARLESSLLLVSFSIFGASMVLLYAASTFYHSATNPKIRYRLNILDHASIYLLIAGTYTPFALVTLSGWIGWTIFGVVWAMALTGIILKLFYTGRYNLLSTIMYVVMGWIIVFAVKPLISNLDMHGLMWLVAGGLSYTVGAGFFLLDKVRYNHAIFHLFVLLGSFCHFISIYFYVLPG
ncbi:hemolysin III family protein [Antarcticibacterium sp. 1MA-6-2]|uniref:PAQR family membrane homeostasis protein TrhA n=1 Tax=Antarcticibacterium sp. 1MA-6-2 TaxID=2908210 RepID=UPI001F22E94F|nr:hemolysin III family protein [Antarcticibacterium sp. 1MA-6-2]UJH92040.1 hemolysin III family protein [Antarcticibacterium sp. 1MA-6-2]